MKSSPTTVLFMPVFVGAAWATSIVNDPRAPTEPFRGRAQITVDYAVGPAGCLDFNGEWVQGSGTCAKFHTKWKNATHFQLFSNKPGDSHDYFCVIENDLAKMFECVFEPFTDDLYFSNDGVFLEGHGKISFFAEKEGHKANLALHKTKKYQLPVGLHWGKESPSPP